MRPELLKTLRDVISDGRDVKRRAAAAISSVERTGSATQKQALTDFFSDCGVKAGGTPPAILPALQAAVSDAGTQVVSSSAGVSYAVSGTYTIASNVIISFKLPATAAIVKDAGVVVARDWAGNDPVNTTIGVVAGAVTFVKLPSTVKCVTSGTKIVVPVTGTFVNGITPTIANGVITGFVLS